ncbi:uncharacterized protein LOC115339860 [Aquila chrysaetos chrysaetos]|uniref:uncharacterized protein LOC115339860 n=1 Tax=Aquila chrysaetos chrysaetos TaxID=223781 RepID=UPI001176D399|nr:uncharacterized protein LOC115339860 [Aquila chrysaetos chrysaetos]
MPSAPPPHTTPHHTPPFTRRTADWAAPPQRGRRLAESGSLRVTRRRSKRGGGADERGRAGTGIGRREAWQRRVRAAASSVRCPLAGSNGRRAPEGTAGRPPAHGGRLTGKAAARRAGQSDPALLLSRFVSRRAAGSWRRPACPVRAVGPGPRSQPLLLGKETHREAQESVTCFTVLLVEIESISAVSHILRTDIYAIEQAFQQSHWGSLLPSPFAACSCLGKEREHLEPLLCSQIYRYCLLPVQRKKNVQELDFNDVLFILSHG